MEHMAQFERQTHQTPSVFTHRNGLLQRKCACGGVAGIDGMCEECRGQKISLQQNSLNLAELPRLTPPGRNEPQAFRQPLNTTMQRSVEPRFGHDFGLVRVKGATPGPIQAKLTIGQPGDRFEQEADQVAEHVMRMTASEAVESMGSADPPLPLRIQRLSLQSEKVHRQSEEEVLQTRGSPDNTPTVTSGLQSHIHALEGGGQPLPEATCAFMEPRFGHDFSYVRVHTDQRAAKSARAVGALAYTVGHDIVFGEGQYNPGTTPGRRLLAHELTHTMQQPSHLAQSSQENLIVSSPQDANEREAERIVSIIEQGIVAHKLAQETQPAVRSNQLLRQKGKKPPSVIQRKEPEATKPSPGALKAIAQAKKQYQQTDPAIWFDSWGNDQRDNNLNGAIDDKSEQGLSDGSHYGKNYNARICKKPADRTDGCPATEQSAIKVQYKVCIDIPIEAYKTAGVSISTSRRIPSFFGNLQKRSDWTVWKAPAHPSRLLDGDIVAAANEAHQHAGIVETGFPFNKVINLPGPSAAQKYRIFKPSGKNDMVSVPRFLFESFLGIDWIARPKT